MHFRFVIVKHVRRDLIGELPLPQRLKDYLCSPHYYSEQVEQCMAAASTTERSPQTLKRRSLRTPSRNSNPSRVGSSPRTFERRRSPLAAERSSPASSATASVDSSSPAIQANEGRSDRNPLDEFRPPAPLTIETDSKMIPVEFLPSSLSQSSQSFPKTTSEEKACDDSGLSCKSTSLSPKFHHQKTNICTVSSNATQCNNSNPSPISSPQLLPKQNEKSPATPSTSPASSPGRNERGRRKNSSATRAAEENSGNESRSGSRSPAKRNCNGRTPLCPVVSPLITRQADPFSASPALQGIIALAPSTSSSLICHRDLTGLPPPPSSFGAEADRGGAVVVPEDAGLVEASCPPLIGPPQTFVQDLGSF